jgi:hypothetical protein
LFRVSAPCVPSGLSKDIILGQGTMKGSRHGEHEQDFTSKVTHSSIAGLSPCYIQIAI